MIGLDAIENYRSMFKNKSQKFYDDYQDSGSSSKLRKYYEYDELYMICELAYRQRLYELTERSKK